MSIDTKFKKSDEGIFLGYSLNSKAFRIYNKRTMTIEESIHVAFDETNSISPRKDILDDITNTLEDTHIHEEVHKDKEVGNSRDSKTKENQSQRNTLARAQPRSTRKSQKHSNNVPRLSLLSLTTASSPNLMNK